MATVKRITAEMVLENSRFNRDIKTTNAELRNVKAELQKTGAEVGTFGRDSEKLGSIQQSLSRQLSLQSEKVDLYGKDIEKTTVKMNKNIKERDKLGVSLEKANKKYDEAVKLYGKESEQAKKAKEEVDRLTKEYDKKEQAIEANAKSIQRYDTNMKKAQRDMAKTQAELNKINEELERSNNKWIRAGETLERSGKKLQNIGGAVEGVGDKILKLSAPMIAAGGASLKFATDFEDSVAKLSAIADETQVPINKLREDILKLSDDTGVASTKIAEDTYQAISAGQETGNAVAFVAKNTKLAKAGFAETSDSLDLLTTILNAYNMESEKTAEISDMLIITQDLGKISVGEMGQVMGRVIPVAEGANVGFEQIATSYAQMTKNGMNANITTTYLASMLNELSKTGSKADKALRKISGKSFAELMAEGKDLSDVLLMLDDYAKKNKLSLKDMFGQVQAGSAALTLVKGEGKEFNEILKEMENSAGATDKAFEKVTNTTGERMKRSLNEMKNQSIRFGDAIAPIMDKASEGIGKLADKLGQLDDKQIENLVSMGKFVVGAGLALKVGGKATRGIGTIVGGLGKLSGKIGEATLATKGIETAASLAGGAGGLGALASGIGGAVVAAGPFLLAGAAIAGVGYGVKKAMEQEAVPAVDLFADHTEYTAQKTTEGAHQIYGAYETTTTKISESTKEAVGAYLELDESAREHLSNLYLNSTQITEEMKEELIEKYAEMNTSISESLASRREEDLQGLRDFFEDNRAITTDEQEEILESVEKHWRVRQSHVDNYQRQINEIIEKASEENRELKASEVEEINELQRLMKEEAIKIMSENEVEAQIILDRMADYDGRITAEMASEHIKELNRSRDEAVKAAEDEYKKRLEAIIRMRDESGVISEDQADKMIEEAKRQRDEVINKAEDTRYGALEKIRSLYKDLDDEVDTGTGKILGSLDKLKRWWSGWKPERKTFSYTVKGSEIRGSGGLAIGTNWRGTEYFDGGLTTLHERGYEVYSLPRGSKVYNHEASERMVTKTAEKVAEKVAKNVLSGVGGAGGSQEIIVPVYLEGREIARVTTPYISENLARNTKGRR